MDINELRALTKKAIEDSIREKQQKEKEEAEALAREERKAHSRAEDIIASIPLKARTAATKGESKVVIMCLEYGEFTQDGAIDYGIKGLTARLVWDSVKDFNPVLEYWHDGCGMKSGYHIVISW